jgi:hypothetical protein
VWSPKKFNVYLCQKVPFVNACFQASAAPRPEISDSEEKAALFVLDTQITLIIVLSRQLRMPQNDENSIEINLKFSILKRIDKIK